MFVWAYRDSMATIVPGAVVRYFCGNSSALLEYFFGSSDNELSMEDPESDVNIVEPNVDEEAPLLGAQNDSMV